ncbi:hypothetical protein [Parashewanella tropica]|uniref:hypothetical protein n=1 Tax=Parashewanella tropica TaxID=2547970 RepID=UPI001059FD96|nr:hypothetical protein [Parashewanella tropica]
MSTPKLYLKLIIFLLFIALVSIATFAFEQHQQIKKLESDVEQLTASQVVFVVSNENAKDLSQWLQKKPEMIKEWLAKSNQTPKQPASPSKKKTKAVEPLSQNSNIKQYQLPNGGTLITTRELQR